jgi:23S rRNA-/tRNA-specific pseudouridylate synthase
MNTMMLHAETLRFMHPVSNEPMLLKADFQKEFKRTLAFLHLD